MKTILLALFLSLAGIAVVTAQPISIPPVSLLNTSKCNDPVHPSFKSLVDHVLVTGKTISYIVRRVPKNYDFSINDPVAINFITKVIAQDPAIRNLVTFSIFQKADFNGFKACAIRLNGSLNNFMGFNGTPCYGFTSASLKVNGVDMNGSYDFISSNGKDFLFGNKVSGERVLLTFSKDNF